MNDFNKKKIGYLSYINVKWTAFILSVYCDVKGQYFDNFNLNFEVNLILGKRLIF